MRFGGGAIQFVRLIQRTHLLNCPNCYTNLFRGKCVQVSNPEFRVVFLGNDRFSIPSLNVVLEAVRSSECLSVVVSNRDNAVGKMASSRNLNVILWEDFKSESWGAKKFDIGVVASFGHLIPKRLIERCEKGILNVHASVLPKLRGAAPINWAIINGYAETGISIMCIAPHRFDVGPVLLKKICRLDPHIRAPELTQLLASMGADGLKQVLNDLENVLQSGEKQVEEDATLAPKITSSLAHVRWDKYSAVKVYNLFRGLYGSHKLYTFYANRRVDLDDIGCVQAGSSSVTGSENNTSDQKDAISLDEKTDFSQFYRSSVILNVPPDHTIWKRSFVPGQMLVYNNSLLVCCADENWVFIDRVKVGKKWMSAKDFQNGFISKNRDSPIFSSNDLSLEDASKTPHKSAVR